MTATPSETTLKHGVTTWSGWFETIVKLHAKSTTLATDSLG